MENLKSFEKGEARAKELGRKGGLQVSVRKTLASRIRMLKQKYPQTTAKELSQFIGILCDLGEYHDFLACELAEFLILKEEYLQTAQPSEQRYDIQKEYVHTLLEIYRVIWHDKSFVQQINVTQQANPKITVEQAKQAFLEALEKRKAAIQ
ncbi:MAG: hypothetical protein EPN88_02120 [Bacteroidetes bacterium]|nr:MAG: hypothetical protein EPN88_02120 [Bacteroidota bacterium]